VAEEARVLLEVLAGRLPVIERTILLGHVRDGVKLSELARQLGQRPRQVRRRWQMVKRWLRDEIELSAGSRRPTLGPNRGPGHE
jgi:DNA-directed RNA polymerase specialized sigma24 family protein